MSISTIRAKYPDHVPCEVTFDSSPLMKILLPIDTTVAEAHMCIRKRMLQKGVQLKKEEAIFLFIGTGTLACASNLLAHYDTDATIPLRVNVQKENTFG